jgi:lysophospholipase L1-like esterase
MNGWLKEYAGEAGLTYLDYYSALAEGRNLRKELTSDGFLPNAAGYAMMAPLAEEAVSKALQ